MRTTSPRPHSRYSNFLAIFEGALGRLACVVCLAGVAVPFVMVTKAGSLRNKGNMRFAKPMTCLPLQVGAKRASAAQAATLAQKKAKAAAATPASTPATGGKCSCLPVL